MRPLSSLVSKSLETLWHKSCALCESLYPEMHHALMYSGRQVDELYAIVPLCMYCHRGAFGDIPQQNREIAELIAIIRGADELNQAYPRTNWEQRKTYLLNKYANNSRFLYAGKKFTACVHAANNSVFADHGGGSAGNNQKAHKNKKHKSK